MLMWNDEFLCEKPHEIDTVGSEDRLAGKIRSDKTLREELKDQSKKTQKVYSHETYSQWILKKFHHS